MCPRKVQRMPRKTIWVDDRCRITIPAYLREAAGIEKECWVVVEAYPDLEGCKALFVRRDEPGFPSLVRG